MAFQVGTATLNCPHCGASHKARWHRLPVREAYSIKCRACEDTLAEGKGTTDYFDVQLIKT
jgi:transposase-like protein